MLAPCQGRRPERGSGPSASRWASTAHVPHLCLRKHNTTCKDDARQVGTRRAGKHMCRWTGPLHPVPGTRPTQLRSRAAPRRTQSTCALNLDPCRATDFMVCSRVWLLRDAADLGPAGGERPGRLPPPCAPPHPQLQARRQALAPAPARSCRRHQRCCAACRGFGMAGWHACPASRCKADALPPTCRAPAGARRRRRHSLRGCQSSSRPPWSRSTQTRHRSRRGGVTRLDLPGPAGCAGGGVVVGDLHWPGTHPRGPSASPP